MPEKSSDFLATELLSELKEENKRKDELINNLHKKDFRKNITFVITLLAVIALFLGYLYQYDFTSVQTVSGVYALVDSEGNVIANDLSPEEVQSLLEVTSNGESEN